MSVLEHLAMKIIAHRWVMGSGGFIGEASLAVPDEELARHTRKGVQLLELTDVYVHPLRRRNRWAHALLETATTHADAEHIDLVLRTIPYGKGDTLDWQRLAALYAQYGFRPRKCDPRQMVRRCVALKS